MEKFIDNDLKNNISNDICNKFSKIISIDQLKEYIKINGIQKTLNFYFEDSDNLEVIIINLLSENPSHFIKNAFALKSENIEVEYTLSGEGYDKYEQRGSCTGEAYILGYSQILSVNSTDSICSYHTDDKETDLTREIGLELDIHIITPFEKKVYYSCKYNCYKIPDCVLFDEIKYYMILEIVGVKDNDNVPAWLLDLIESASNLKVGNYKMAFLNVFTALDYYIEDLYVTLFDNYIENFNVYSKKSPQDSNCLKERIRRYSNLGRNLLDDKLNDIWKETDKTNSYYSTIKSELKLLVLKRNKLAHGEKVEIDREDYGKLLYYLFDLICLLNGYKSLVDFLKS